MTFDRRWLFVCGGAVAVAAGAAAIFLAHQQGGSSHQQQQSATATPVSIEMRIAAANAGVVIGRGGENIRDIQAKTSTKIFFKDELSTETERFLVIVGQEAQLAEILIRQTIANQPRLETLELRVPENVVPRLIGRQGETIKRMQMQSRCKIHVDRGHNQGELAKVTLRGTADQISQATVLIQEKVEEEKQLDKKVKDSLRNRSPRIKYKQPLFLKAENEEEEEENKNIKEKYEKLEQHTGESTLEVFVSSVSDPGCFYVQRIGQKSVDLDKLAQDMTNFYENEVNRKMNAVTEVCAGDLVATQFSGDSKWYRAKVAQVITDEYDQLKQTIDIDFVDFGDMETKTKEQVCELKTEYLRLSFQAIKCTLADVEPISNGGWTAEAVDDFERLTKCAQWTELQANIVTYNTQNQSLVPVVQLCDHTGEEPLDIGQELIRLGHARLTNKDSMESMKEEIGLSL